MKCTVKFNIKDHELNLIDGPAQVNVTLLNQHGVRRLARIIGDTALHSGDRISVPFAAGRASVDMVWASRLPAEFMYHVSITDAAGEHVFGAFRLPDMSEIDFTALLDMTTAPAPGAPLPRVVITTEQLQALVDGHGIGVETGAGLSGTGQSQTPIIVPAGGIQTSMLADGAVTEDKLQSLILGDVRGSIPYDGLTADGDGTLDVARNDGRATKQLDIGVNGVTAAREINALTGGLRVSYNSLRDTPNIPAGGSPSQSAHDALETRVATDESKLDDLRAFRDSLRNTASFLAHGAWTQGASLSLTRLPGSPKFPAANADAEIDYVFSGDEQLSGTFKQALLAGKSANNGAQASQANSVQLGTDPAFYLTTEAGDGQILVAAADLGSFAVMLSQDRTQIKANQLDPSINLGGQTAAQVTQAIAAGVQDWAEAGNTDPIPAAKLTNAPSGGDTSGGSGAALDEIFNGSEVVITTGTSAGVWTGWTDVLEHTITASQAGMNILFANTHGISDSGDGGGDRIYSDLQVLRQRTGETDLMKLDLRGYVRNAGNFHGGQPQPPNETNEASRHSTVSAVVACELNTGDTIKVQVRALSQTASETMRFAASSETARNQSMQLLTLGGGGGSGGLDRNTVLGLISDWAEAGNAAAIPAGKLANAPGLAQTAVDGRIRAVAPGIATTQANAQIVARVETFAQDGNNARITEAKLPQKLDDLLDATDEAGWVDAGSNPQTAPWVSQAVYVNQRPPNPQTVTYVRSWDYPFTALRNRYILVRVPDGAPSPGDNMRLNVGERDEGVDLASSSSDWVFLSRIGSNRYYSAPFAMSPVGADMRVQLYDPFHLDPDKIDNVLPEGGANGQLLGRSGGRAAWESYRVKQVHDGPGAGLAIQNTNSTVNSAFNAFTFDLDDADKQRGYVAVEVELTMSSPSSPQLGFGAAGVLTARWTDVVFVSTLRRLATWLLGTQSTWLKVGSGVQVNQGGTDLGPVDMYLGKNASNEMGYFMRYRGHASAGATLSVGTRIGAVYNPAVV